MRIENSQITAHKTGKHQNRASTQHKVAQEAEAFNHHPKRKLGPNTVQIHSDHHTPQFPIQPIQLQKNLPGDRRADVDPTTHNSIDATERSRISSQFASTRRLIPHPHTSVFIRTVRVPHATVPIQNSEDRILLESFPDSFHFHFLLRLGSVLVLPLLLLFVPLLPLSAVPGDLLLATTTQPVIYVTRLDSVHAAATQERCSAKR